MVKLSSAADLIGDGLIGPSVLKQYCQRGLIKGARKDPETGWWFLPTKAVDDLRELLQTQKTFGQQLLAWRQEQELSQYAAAGVLGVDYATVGHWEVARRLPHLWDIPGYLLTMERYRPGRRKRRKVPA